MYSIEFTENAANFIRKLDKNIRERVLNKVKELKENPHLGKSLVGNLSGLWRLRIGDYRATYRIENEKLIIVIIEVGHRKKIYD
jgi:mRNA interferase RelE/StbE